MTECVDLPDAAILRDMILKNSTIVSLENLRHYIALRIRLDAELNRPAAMIKMVEMNLPNEALDGVLWKIISEWLKGEGICTKERFQDHIDEG